MEPAEPFVAIDVEIASRSPVRICALGAARFESGRETAFFRSLVHVDGRVRYSGIHGLDERDLIGAPPWPVVWSACLQLIGGIRTLVAFRAAFDRGAILVMCAAHGLRPGPLRFVCAAAMVEKRFQRSLDLREALDALALPFPGRHHDPLSDARAAAAIAITCGLPRPTAARGRPNV